MNTSANHISSSLKAVLQTVLLFVLAVLLLVVSCPLKRVLQNDFTSASSSPARTNQTNITQASASDYLVSNDACGVKQKAELTKFKISQPIKNAAFTNLPYISNPAGFALHHFLGRISYPADFVVYSHSSSLPLYLQHLRLLI